MRALQEVTRQGDELRSPPCRAFFLAGSPLKKDSLTARAFGPGVRLVRAVT